MKKLLGLSLSMALLALAVSPAFAQSSDSAVNVAGDVTLATQGLFDTGAINMNMTASNDAALTVTGAIAAEAGEHNSDGTADNGVADEFDATVDGLLVTSTQGPAAAFILDVESSDLLQDVANGTSLDVVGASALTVPNNVDDSNDNDVTFSILAEATAPTRAAATQTQDAVNDTDGAGCAPDLAGADDSTTFTAVDDIANVSDAAPSPFYEYDGTTSVNDNGCSEFSLDVFPAIELTTNEEGVAGGIYTGTLTFSVI